MDRHLRTQIDAATLISVVRGVAAQARSHAPYAATVKEVRRLFS